MYQVLENLHSPYLHKISISDFSINHNDVGWNGKVQLSQDFDSDYIELDVESNLGGGSIYWELLEPDWMQVEFDFKSLALTTILDALQVDYSDLALGKLNTKWFHAP